MNKIYDTIKIEQYVIMPNHVHLLMNISCGLQGAPRSSPATSSVSKFITAFKKFTNKQAESSIWQRSFYDHVIRDETDLINHIQYIAENPKKWIMGKGEYYS
ncbi:MAG: transposase [Clostridia bacterium]|nr:transposase [Clostridia bacterium]